MANAAAFQQGYATGQGIADEQRLHKQMLSDEEFQSHLNEIQTNIGNLQTKLSTLDPSSPEYEQAKNSLQQSIQSRNDLFHPAKNPGALAKFGHLLRIGPKVETPVAPQRISETENPGVAASTVNLGPDQPVSFPAADPTTAQGPGGKSVTDTPEDVQMPTTSTSVAMPAAPEYKSTQVGKAQAPGEYAPGTPAELKARAARLQKVKSETDQIAAAAPMSPSQLSIQQMRAKVAEIDASPLSDEDKDEAKRKLFGVNTKPEMKLYTLPNGTQGYYDVSRPDLIPQGATAYVKEDSFSRLVADYNADPRPVSEKGSLQHYKAMQGVRPSSGVEAQLIRALYGDNPTAEQMKKGISEYKELNTPVRTSASQQLVFDNEGKPHVFERVSTSSSSFHGGGASPSAPATPSAPTGASSVPPPPPNKPSTPDRPQQPTATVTTPRKPAPSASGTPKAPKSPIGPALDGFTKPTPVVTKAQENVVAAKTIDSLAKKAVASNDTIQQKQLALGLIKAMAGRVNMQEFEQYTKHLGVENTWEGFYNGIAKQGQLPDGVVNSLAKAAHAYLASTQDALRDALAGNDAMTGGDADWKPPVGAPDPSQYADGHELYNKKTHKVDAVTKGGKWTRPPQ